MMCNEGIHTRHARARFPGEGTDEPGPGGPFGGPGGHRGGGRPFWGPKGVGPFGAMFAELGGFGPGGPRWRRRRGDVRTALLLLLHLDGPANGYQLMQALEQRSDGRWRPSPGSVYPALAQLEDEGLIRQVSIDSGRVFEITDAGREQVEARGDQKPPWEPEGEIHEAYVDFKRAIASTAKAAMQVLQDGDQHQVARAAELLEEVRRALYRLLAGDDPAARKSDPGSTDQDES